MFPRGGTGGGVFCEDELDFPVKPAAEFAAEFCCREAPRRASNALKQIISVFLSFYFGRDSTVRLLATHLMNSHAGFVVLHH